MKKDESKIDDKTADVEFERFVDAMDLYFDLEELDAEELSDYKKLKGKFIRAVQQGSLVINESGEAVYTPANKNSKHTDPITFHEQDGAALMAMDKKKKNHDVAKTYAVMGDMCKVHPSVFAKLKGADIKVCMAIFALLMD